MRNAQKNIKDTDVEIFLYYNPDVAVQIVTDLIDEPVKNMNGGMVNAIDKETRHLA